MAAREDILAAISAHGPEPRELPHVPDFSRAPADLVSVFTDALARLDGKTVAQPSADLQTWLSETFPDATRVCSTAPEVTGTVALAGFPDWAAPADVDVTVVRAPLGVARDGLGTAHRVRARDQHHRRARPAPGRAARSR
jgi:hypothetical protein